MWLAYIAVVVSIVAACSSSSVGSSRIVTGKETTIEQKPYQVSVQSRGRHVCGGAIFKWDAVVTAGFCLIGTTAKDLAVLAGRTNLEDEGGFLKPVYHIYRHPDFDSITLENNIAVLLFEENFQFGDTVQPIQLSFSESDCEEGDPASFSGWGASRQYGAISNTLREIDVTIESMEKCKLVYSNLSPSLLCAGDLETWKDACEGDYGGPLVAKGRLIGILSWIYGCGKKGHPSVYNKIPAYTEWIANLEYP